ncbi:MAG TPA: hypothetical protein VGJ22_08390 [Anaerolineales bacterium]
MHKAQRLLDRAYWLVEKRRVADAVHVLNIVICDDPHNIEAWELCVQISGSRQGLQNLAERVRRDRDLTAGEKREILEYQEYMLSHLDRQAAASDGGSRSALMIISAILVAVIGLWLVVPEIRRMSAYYFLVAFILGLGYWFWKSDRSERYAGARSFGYEITTPRLVETEKPELFFYEPIIKVGPAPEDDRNY